MNEYNCALCKEEYYCVISNPINGGRLQICKTHYDYVERLRNDVLTALIMVAADA
jgi:hypothetical protein